jgi:hypothetical protein
MLTSGLFDEKEKTLLSKLSREEEMFAVKNKNKNKDKRCKSDLLYK